MGAATFALILAMTAPGNWTTKDPAAPVTAQVVYFAHADLCRAGLDKIRQTFGDAVRGVCVPLVGGVP